MGEARNRNLLVKEVQFPVSVASSPMQPESMWARQRFSLPSRRTEILARFAVLRLLPRICTGSKAGIQQCGITTVAMESTGVYWIPLFQILEKAGMELYLVNAQALAFARSPCVLHHRRPTPRTDNCSTRNCVIGH